MTDQLYPQEKKIQSLLLPFTGSKGTTIVKNLNETLKNVPPSNAKTSITYTDQNIK